MTEETTLDLLSPSSGAAAKQPCGCHETYSEGAGMESDPFALELSSGGDPAAALEAALSALESGGAGGGDVAALDTLSAEEELEFASLGEEGGLSLEDLLTFAARNPGLKITFSF